MNASIFAAILIIVTNFRLYQGRRYDNYSLYSVTPTELDHIKFLQNLEKKKYIEVIFWKKSYKTHEKVQFIVNPANKDAFMERARHFRMDVKIMLPNVQEAFDAQIVRRYTRLRTEAYSWKDYHTLEDIYQWLSDIALKFPSFVEISSIGKSFNGKDIYALAIKRPGANEKVIVEGGIHGNEWISTEFVTYLAHQLIYVDGAKNKRLFDLANKYQWYLIPVANPDGYEYSHSKDRLWRKNRNTIHSGVGVDLNRNFGYAFGKHEVSSDPKDDNYCGPAAFSEPETRALRDFVKKKSKNLKFYFAFHSYGEKIIIPYADKIQHVDNYVEMENFAKQAIYTIYKLNGTKYSVGTNYDTLGLRISGNSASWVKKNYKVKYVFTFLLRDNGAYGYTLPNEQILPTCAETSVGLLEIMTARMKRLRADLFSSGAETKTGIMPLVACAAFWTLK